MHHAPIEPWRIVEPEFNIDNMGTMESIFTVSNGFMGLRGNLDEGEPNREAGTYIAGFFERHPLPYAEGGYGYPEDGQSMLNAINGKIIRLMVDDEPFDIRYGYLPKHERILDMRGGQLHRDVEWVSPDAKPVKVSSTRLVSFTHRSVAAIDYTVEATDRPARIILQSELVANEAPPEVEVDDPRVAAALENALLPIDQEHNKTQAALGMSTRRSKLTLAAGMEHVIECDGKYDVNTETYEDWARTTIVTTLQPGQKLRLIKFVAYGWSSRRTWPALRDQVAAALAGAQHTGFDGLKEEQHSYLQDFWEVADVEIGGDPALQQAIRFALFQVLQSSARSERAPTGAKGLTGSGYQGHAFWDLEGYVLPLLALTLPNAASHILHWRASLIDKARDRAHELGLEGAAFPWRTIGGEETSAYWPASTASVHINADIARAFELYRLVTGDTTLEEEAGLEVLVETARLWASMGRYDRHGQWHLDGVTGPDEYTAVVDDNVFTNLMAARNLEAAADACIRQAEAAQSLGVQGDEIGQWRAAARSVHVPFDEDLGVHPASVNFTRYAEWDFEAYKGRYPLMMHAPYMNLYRSQVVKQADLVQAMWWCSEAFTDEQKARNFEYYEHRTVRDSSLSAAPQAVMAAEVGHPDLALAYLREAALVDLMNLQGNTHHGLHMASLAGAWLAVVAGLGGLREDGEMLRLWPTLPTTLNRVAFRLRWRGHCLRVDVTRSKVALALVGSDDEEIEVELYGEVVKVPGSSFVHRPLRQPEPTGPTPGQPVGREPLQLY